MSEKLKITLVEPFATDTGQFNDSASHLVTDTLCTTPRALPILEAVGQQAGWTDIVCIAPRHEPGRKPSLRDWDRIRHTDVLAISFMTVAQHQSLDLARQFKKINPKGWVVVGGPHATLKADETLEHCPEIDVVVRREGEKTFPRVLQRLESKEDLAGLDGISYRTPNGSIIHNPESPLLSEAELSSLPVPHVSWEMEREALATSIRTSVGCTHGCEFCTIATCFKHQYRRRSNEAIIAEMKAFRARHPWWKWFHPKGNHFRGGWNFVDDSFAAEEEETYQLAEMMVEEGLNTGGVYGSFAQVRVDLADNEKLCLKMREAGIKILALGFESMNDSTLRSYHKGSSFEKNQKAARELREYGFWLLGSFMVGGDGETPEYLDWLENWAIGHVDAAFFWTPMPLPGTPFEERMAADKRILVPNGYDSVDDYNLREGYRYYDGSHILLQPEYFTPRQLQERRVSMYRHFYSLTNWSNTREVLKRTGVGGLLRDFTFRFFANYIDRLITNNPSFHQHLEMLKQFD